MRRKLVPVAGLLVMAAAGATLAFATTGSDSTTINACVAKNGKVSIYPDNQKCLASENPISWNIQGPAGPPGPPGTGEPTLNAGAAVTISGAGFDPPLIMAISGYSSQVVTPRDPASGLPTGRRQYQPIIIRKRIDKATPLLMKAQVSSQTLPDVLISLADDTGKTEATVRLGNAHVVERNQTMELEDIAFTFRTIQVTWVDGKVMAEDDWEQTTTG